MSIVEILNPGENEESKKIQELFGVDAYPSAVRERGLSFIKGALLILENARLSATELYAYQKELENISVNWLSIAASEYDKESILALKKVLNKKVEGWVPELQQASGLSKKAREKIKKNLKNALYHAENHVNWKEREPISSVIFSENGKSYLERTDEPIMDLTLAQTQEWESILGPESKRPAWFRDLAGWEQEYFRKRVESWDKTKTKNLGEHLSVPPTTVRAYPGARNAYKSTFKIYEKQGKEFVLVSTTQKIRSGHVTPLEMKDKKACLRATKENIKQLMLFDIQNQLENGIQEKDGTLNVLINLQTLVTPFAPHEDYKMNIIRRQAVEELQNEFKGKREFKRFLEENNVEIPTGVKPKLSLITSNHAVNQGRFFVRKHSENKKTLSVINKRLEKLEKMQAGEIRDKGIDLEKVRKAKQKYDQITQTFFSTQRWGNWRAHGVNHNIERAALEQIMIDGLGGIRIGSCKSGKDREGAVNMHMAAMLLYYKEHNNEFPPIPNTRRPFTADEARKREEYEEIVARVFIQGHDTEIANTNSQGARGIKEVGVFLGKNVIKKVGSFIAKNLSSEALEPEELGENAVKTSNKSAGLNKVSEPSLLAKIRGKGVDVDKIDNLTKMLVLNKLPDYKENRFKAILELLESSSDQGIDLTQEHINIYLKIMKEHNLAIEPAVLSTLMHELVSSLKHSHRVQLDENDEVIVDNTPTYTKQEVINKLREMLEAEPDKKKQIYMDLFHTLEAIEEIFSEFITLKINNELGDPLRKIDLERELEKDNLLSEKMQLVLLLAKARGGKISDEVIASYEAKYPGFAEKYKNQKTIADIKSFEDQPQLGGWYKGLSETIEKNQEGEDDFLQEFDESLLLLSADQVDFVNNLEKFFSQTVSETTDGKPLSHLKSVPGSIVFCELKKTNDNYYNITFHPCGNVINNKDFIETLIKLQIPPFVFDKDGIKATLRCSDAQLKELMKVFNESEIIKHKESVAVHGLKTISGIDVFIKEHAAMLASKNSIYFKEKIKKIKKGDQGMLTEKITKDAVLNFLDMISNLPEDMSVFGKLEVQTRILTVLYDNMLLSGFSKIPEKKKVQESIKAMLKKVRQERQGLLIALKENAIERNNLGFLDYDKVAKKYFQEQIKIDFEEEVENKLLKRAAEIPTPFNGHTISSLPPTGGKQEKAEFTGFYMDEYGKEFMIKMSKNHLADNVAEVVTSSILEDIVGEKHSVNYNFIESDNGHMYLKSEKRPEFETLKDRMGRTGGKGFLWLGSNPKFDQNKKIIYKNITLDVENKNNFFSKENRFKRWVHRKLLKENKKIKRQCAKILAATLLVLDSDCQVENMCFYTADSNTQMAKFDDGWGLVGICTPGNERVKLFEKIDYHGTRGTHKEAFLPTNHWLDYPVILHSKEFVDGLREVALKMKENMGGSATKALLKIETAYKEKPIPEFDINSLKINDIDSVKKKREIMLLKEQSRVQVLKLKAYIEFATHIGIYSWGQRKEELEKLEQVDAEDLRKLEELDSKIKLLDDVADVGLKNEIANNIVLHLKGAVDNINGQTTAFREFIQKKLSERLNARADSMLLLSQTLNIAIKMDSGAYKRPKNSPVDPSKTILADLEEVHQILKSVYKTNLNDATLEMIFPEFKEAPKPFVSQTRIAFLEKVLKAIKKDLTKEARKNSETYQYFKKILKDANAKELFRLQVGSKPSKIIDGHEPVILKSTPDIGAFLETMGDIPSTDVTPAIPKISEPALIHPVLPSQLNLLEPSRRSPTILSAYTRPASQTASSNEKLKLSDTDLDKFNTDPNLNKYAKLSCEDNRPKFTGQNLVGVLSACKESEHKAFKELAELTYTLAINSTTPEPLAINQAKRCLEDPIMGKQITILRIGDKVYSDDLRIRDNIDNYQGTIEDFKNKYMGQAGLPSRPALGPGRT